jgi:hypothetical protein
MPPVVHSFPSSCLLAGAAGWPGKKKERKKTGKLQQSNRRVRRQLTAEIGGMWKALVCQCQQPRTHSHMRYWLGKEAVCVRDDWFIVGGRGTKGGGTKNLSFVHLTWAACCYLPLIRKAITREREQSKDVMLRVGAVLRRLQQRVNCVLFLPKEEHGLWQASTADSCRDSRPHVQTASDD